LSAETSPLRAMPAPKIHPTAVVDPAARLSPGVEVGPFCVIGADVELGEGVRLYSHVTVEGPTKIGARCQIHPFAALGGAPQYLGYRGEPTRLEIGADCTIREHVTLHRGTVAGGGLTRVGNCVYIMSQVHVGHDCTVGNGVILAGHCALGGHVTIGDYAIIGAVAGVHQFCRVGTRAIVGGLAAVDMDVIPFGAALGNRARLAGLNVVGLKRAGVAREAIHALRAAYRALFVEDGPAFRLRLDTVEARFGEIAEVAQVLEFIRADTRRPVMPARRVMDDSDD
jgi:UDP-N-acetylglucosamine acyltransferase